MARRLATVESVSASADRLAIMAAAAFTMVAVMLGVSTGYRVADVDELVYRNTVVAMRAGAGYYPAMRDALVEKEGAPPSQIRSVRPPALYLALARFPEGSWRYLAGAAYLAILLLAWRLGRPLHPYGGPIAVLLAGVWVLGAAYYLFLHAELWGLPFLLAGALAMRNNRWALAALAIAGAAVLREIYVLPLLIGLAMAPRRRAWVAAVLAVGALGAVHAGLAARILDPHGKEAAFGSSGLGLHYILSALSPSSQPLGWLVGIAGGTLGAVGLRRRWEEDPAARLLLTFTAAMVPLTVFLGREYWALAFGPAVACFAPAGAVVRDALAVPARRSRVKDVERVASAPVGQVAGQREPLTLAARPGGRRLAEAHAAHAHVDQGGHPEP